MGVTDRALIKVEYHANTKYENQLKISEKIVCWSKVYVSNNG